MLNPSESLTGGGLGDPNRVEETCCRASLKRQWPSHVLEARIIGGCAPER